MRVKLILLFVFFLSSYAIAQMHDSNWLIGGSCVADNDDFILTQLDFRDQNLQPQSTQLFPYFVAQTNSIMSNDVGDLMYYTNGNQVNNWKHEPLKNGEYLVEDDCSWESLPQGAISIPHPIFNDQYILISITNEKFLDSNNSLIVEGKVYFNLIDMVNPHCANRPKEGLKKVEL